MKSLYEAPRMTKKFTPIAARLKVTPQSTMKGIAFPRAIPFFDQADYLWNYRIIV